MIVALQTWIFTTIAGLQSPESHSTTQAKQEPPLGQTLEPAKNQEGVKIAAMGVKTYPSFDSALKDRYAKINSLK